MAARNVKPDGKTRVKNARNPSGRTAPRRGKGSVLAHKPLLAEDPQVLRDGRQAQSETDGKLLLGNTAGFIDGAEDAVAVETAQLQAVARRGAHASSPIRMPSQASVTGQGKLRPASHAASSSPVEV